MLIFVKRAGEDEGKILSLNAAPEKPIVEVMKVVRERKKGERLGPRRPSCCRCS